MPRRSWRSRSTAHRSRARWGTDPGRRVVIIERFPAEGRARSHFVNNVFGILLRTDTFSAGIDELELRDDGIHLVIVTSRDGNKKEALRGARFLVNGVRNCGLRRGDLPAMMGYHGSRHRVLRVGHQRHSEQYDLEPSPHRDSVCPGANRLLDNESEAGTNSGGLVPIA